MIDDPRQWHYAKLNEANRYPRRHICLDAESQRYKDGSADVHKFGLAVASYDRIPTASCPDGRTEWMETDHAEDLWEWINSKTSRDERTILWAHNLGYDLRIAQGLTILPKLGWNLQFISLDGRRTFARFRRDRRTLTLTDSSSYFPKSLEAMAAELGMEKVPLPEWGDLPDKWFHRCRVDVEILRKSVLQLLWWLESNDCGNFKPTGPAMSWAMFRHRFLPPRRLLIHREDEVLDAERRAAWTGRAEAWRHGEFDYPVHEYDYRLAYATIATETEVPVRYLGSRVYGKNGKPYAIRKGYSTLYNCEVEQDAPIVPAEHNGKIVWPKGRFVTSLWDRELALLQDRNFPIRILKSYRYCSYPLLNEWGRWIIAALTDESDTIPPLIRIMLKHWARALIGRFGMRYPDWHPVGESVEEDLVHFQCHTMDSDEICEYLQIGTAWYRCDDRQNGHDTAPAVMSYVMALQRVKLWEAIEAIGESEMLYCDTDSILTTTAGAKRLDELRQQPLHGNLLPKARYEHIEIHAPRCIVLDGEPRIAGLPRKATQTSRRGYKYESWQTLGDSIKTGNPTEVRVTPRSFQIKKTDSRRRHLRNGKTAPFSLNGGS